MKSLFDRWLKYNKIIDMQKSFVTKTCEYENMNTLKDRPEGIDITLYAKNIMIAYLIPFNI